MKIIKGLTALIIVFAISMIVASNIIAEEKQEGLVTMRLKFPPHYKLAPHTHPADERVTVISGTLFFGMGDNVDAKKAKALKAGSFFIMPPNTGMFGWTGNKETIIQLNVMGPWGINY